MIDLCIVNYNTQPMLKRMLDTLHSDLNYVDKMWNLHVCDNGSKDYSWDWLDSNKEKYYIDAGWKNENIGYSAACNLMASQTKADIICLLNADVWLTSEDVVKVQKLFDNNLDTHIIGPKQRNEHGQITHAGIIGTNKAPKHRGWSVLDKDDVMFRDRVECVTISGSAYFIRRSVWNALTNDEQYKKMYPEAIGAFLPTPHYYEETWCSYFARHRGYKVVYDGSVSIGHSWHASSPKPGEGYSHADSQFKLSQSIFRKACDQLGIERD